ncbi:MAG: VOC family protein [Planctomycetota bacterium]
MKFGYTLLYVTDVDATLDFYQAAFGLERKLYQAEGDQAYGELETGATTLGFASHAVAKSHGFNYAETKPDGPLPAFEIALVTDDVQAAYDKAIEGGAKPVSEPTQKPWGQTVSYVKDINGFLIEVCSPVVEE